VSRFVNEEIAESLGILQSPLDSGLQTGRLNSGPRLRLRPGIALKTATETLRCSWQFFWATSSDMKPKGTT
jgi:hypothetical protein